MKFIPDQVLTISKHSHIVKRILAFAMGAILLLMTASSIAFMASAGNTIEKPLMLGLIFMIAPLGLFLVWAPLFRKNVLKNDDSENNDNSNTDKNDSI